jgi:site-specific DNA-adenine methylase
MNAVAPLVAPFPWFGGKRTIAAEVWARLGRVENYIEPFFGSGAVLLARPDAPTTETVNDVDHFLVNFWRSVQAAPDDVARYADWPVTEADLQARHYWLITEGKQRIASCAGNTDHFDSQVAGWWLWGACAWIGSGWCSGEGPWTWNGIDWQGINRQLPHLSTGQGIKRKLPHLSTGRGINRQLPHLSTGQGINRKLPHLGDARRGIFIADWMRDISARLRHVRVACGDWARVCGDSVTWRHGLTGVFLDPPYGVEDRAKVYNQDCLHVAAKARDWAINAGKRRDMRIAFAGYGSEHAFPNDWSVFRWKAAGGYGSQGDDQGRANSIRETIWFSPACISAAQSDMFAEVSA